MVHSNSMFHLSEDRSKCSKEHRLFDSNFCLKIRDLEERRAVGNEWPAINNSSSGGVIERVERHACAGVGRVLERHACKGHVP